MLIVMGQQNMSYSGPMLDAEPQQVGHQQPEPCMVSYGGTTGFVQPYNDNNNNNHTVLLPPGNRTAFDPRYNHGQLHYVNTQYNTERCNTLMMPGVVNHDHVPFSNNHQSFEGNRSLFMDGSNGVYKSSGSSVAVPVTSEGNRATGPTGFEFDPMVAHNGRRLARVGEVVQAVPVGGFSWNHAYGVQDMGLHGYQVAGMRRNSPAFFMPPRGRPHQGSHNVYHPTLLPPPSTPPPPMLPVQARNMDIQLQLPSTSHTRSTRTSSAYPFHNNADPGPSFVGPAQPHGTMVYEPSPQQLIVESIVRQGTFNELRVLHEDAMIALADLVANLDSGLSDNFISDHLKTRIFASVRHHSEDLTPAEEEPNFCVICQMEFEDQEKIGILDCCHEYHAECIKKWLVMKNNCSICKSKALHSMEGVFSFPLNYGKY